MSRIDTLRNSDSMAMRHVSPHGTPAAYSSQYRAVSSLLPPGSTP